MVSNHPSWRKEGGIQLSLAWGKNPGGKEQHQRNTGGKSRRDQAECLLGKLTLQSFRRNKEQRIRRHPGKQQLSDEEKQQKGKKH